MNIKYAWLLTSLGKPSYEEIELCKLVIKHEAGFLGRGYELDRIDKGAHDIWNLYYDGECIFAIQETDDGYGICHIEKGRISDALRYLQSRD